MMTHQVRDFDSPSPPTIFFLIKKEQQQRKTKRKKKRRKEDQRYKGDFGINATLQTSLSSSFMVRHSFIHGQTLHSFTVKPFIHSRSNPSFIHGQTLHSFTVMMMTVDEQS
jgi:hypothetical protein